MSLFGALKSFGKAASGLSHMPFVGSALRAMPFVSTAMSAIDIGTSLYGMMPHGGGGGGGGGVGAGLPALPAGGLPPLSGGMGMLSPGGGGGAGVPMLAGPGGAMVPSGGHGLKTVHVSPMFPTDMASLKGLESAGIIVPFNHLGTAHRAPRGYRVVHVNGMTLGVRTDVARRLHLVAPHHKPPISVGEWHALKKSHHVIKKMAKVNKMVHAIQRHSGGRKSLPAIHHKKRK